MTLARRIVVTENTSVGAGKQSEDRIRVLTLVEQMYADARREAKRNPNKKPIITFAHVCAADRYRETFLEARGPSVGVSSYGNSPGGGNKYNRTGTTDQRMHNSGRLEDARLAMCGVIAEDERRNIDRPLVALMEAAIVETADTPTQTHIGVQRTGYTGAKQAAAAGGTVIVECLNRLLLYYRTMEA